MSSWDWNEGYDRSDPKHSGWHGMMADRADDDRKRVRLGEIRRCAVTQELGQTFRCELTEGHSGPHRMEKA